jgi:hypothetical protein
MKFVKYALLIPVICFVGCASMDLRVDELPLSNTYGGVQPRIPFEGFKYFSGEPDRAYVKLADLVVQEEPTVITSHSAQEMTRHLCKIAWGKGADAVINVSISTTSVAGGAARTSAIVKGTAVRWKD